ncbi:hypothetical protein BJV78DRAFT_251504 [Lactifluus subvellereus]|nr:hypothetical protein BJV78DRAFT_251504 [Lactifluus subvellereus]
MLSMQAPTLRRRLPPIRTDVRLEIEPDEQWKDDLRKRIEHNLRYMVEDARIVRDTILNSRPPKGSRERALQDYENSMAAIRRSAQEEFTRQLRLEMSERKWALDVIDSNSPDVARQQQRILDNTQKSQDERISSGPQKQGYDAESDEGHASDESSESEEDDDEDEEEETHDSYGHPPRWDGSQPYVTGAAPRRPSPGSRAPSWRPHPRPPEPSGISRTFFHANGQTYSASPVPFPRRGNVNSTGSTGSGAGLHRAGSLNSGQYRSSSVARRTPGGGERSPTQRRDRIAPNISPSERQTSASASPHDRPSPPSYSIGSPRAIPGARPPSLNESMRFPISASPSSRAIYDPQRSPQDMRQGITIPRGPTASDEGPRGGSWDSGPLSPHFLNGFNAHRRHNSKGEPRLPPVDDNYPDDSNDVVGRPDDHQSMHSARSLQSAPSMRGTSLEARRLEERARQSLNHSARLGAEARQAEASAKMREAAAQTKEAEAKKREAEAQKREAEARRKEEVARHRELEARRKEEQARRKEEEAQRKEEEAKRRRRSSSGRRKTLDGEKRTRGSWK